MSSGEGSYDDSLLNKKERFQELQKNAYYDLLHAFISESLQQSRERVLIIRDLKKEWNITETTFKDFKRRLGKEPLILYLRKEKEKQRLASIANKSNNSEESYVPSWGKVRPESLVNKWIKIRLPGEEEFIAFHIKGYNKQEETHHLVSAYIPPDYKNPCDWIDIRHFAEDDVIWLDECPRLIVRKQKRERFPTANRTLLQKTLLREAKKAHAQNKDAESDEGEDIADAEMTDA